MSKMLSNQLNKVVSYYCIKKYIIPLKHGENFNDIVICDPININWDINFWIEDAKVRLEGWAA